jgi:methyl-accepting chemotaxis protein
MLQFLRKSEGLKMDRVQRLKGGGNKRYGKIGRKIGCVVAFMQLISVVLAVVICVFMFDSLVTKMQEDRCTNGTNMLAHELSRVSDGEDINQILDELKSLMGCEFTVFEGDTRAYSTVTNNGKRVVGTKLSSELIEIVLKKGKSYVGEADILGSSYLCSYVPTKGDDGKVDGLIFAGISRAEAEQKTRDVITMAAVISGIVIFICILFMAAYLGRRVSSPLGKITQAAKRLEGGDLGLASGEEVRLNVRSKDEIGMLGVIFEDTIGQLRGYIGEIGNILGAIADGDLTQSTNQNYSGDFLSIKQSLDSIQNALNRTMGQIAASAVQVSDGSDQVASSAQSLAQGATEQASSVEQISATVTDIAENTRQTSATTVETGEYVDKAGAQLGVSLDYVKELNVAMEHISNSSQEISTIIATIENIAFQIRILALNASVEASRAGTAGKGFAVVADEVRTLASKSDEAAKATKELIESSIAAITEGGDVVNKVTEALELTGKFASNVTTNTAVVVESVQSQASAIAQVAEGITQISAVVQTNSATSEQCAAASEELSSQASLLKNLISSFKIRS